MGASQVHHSIFADHILGICVGRYGEGEDATLSLGRVNADGAAVAFDDSTGDKQTDPRSTDGSSRAV